LAPFSVCMGQPRMILSDPATMANPMTAEADFQDSRYELDQPRQDTLRIRFFGDWRLREQLPTSEAVDRYLQSDETIRHIAFDSGELRSWDSGFLNFLVKLGKTAAARQIVLDNRNLPQGVERLLALAAAVPPKATYSDHAPASLLVRLGEAATRFGATAADMVGFLGEAVLALANLARGRARFQTSELLLVLQECGVEALPIVTLISILVGMILAFVGAMQLKMFGAEVYVANLVTLGMAREMAAMMTGIIMAGRTGAAFAAKLGTMQVNEEVDALQTLGIPPMEFLVLPRLLALVLMMPLLCIYANLMGVFGGLMVAAGMFDITAVQYITQAKVYIGLVDFQVGIFKSVIFGAVVALCGCYYGMRCGRSSAGVGLATTSAVVSAIVFIIVCDSLVTFVTTIVGI